MAVAAGGPRLLLRRLREIMAEQSSAQTRLDKLVTVIATNMVAEVCSIYLRLAGAAQIDRADFGHHVGGDHGHELVEARQIGRASCRERV